MDKKYNSYDFIKKNIPEIPKLRFRGKSVEEYEIWQKNTKNKLSEILGLEKLNSLKSLSDAMFLEEVDCGEYLRKKFEIETVFDLKMPFYLLEPKQKNNGKAVIAIHGHASQGKEGLVGNESEDYKANITKFNYKYALELVESGFNVFVPDLLGAGERTLGIYKDKTPECNDINNALISLGLCLQGVILYENMRLVDYIEKSGYKEIYSCGFSGGGHSALWLCVFDERVKNGIISGFLHSFKDNVIYLNRCGCNFIPNQWLYVDMGDILALCAKKDMYIETGKDDGLNGERGIVGVFEQIEIANNAFKLFKREVKLSVNKGKHQWYGKYDYNEIFR